MVGRGRPTILRSALPPLSCRSPLGRGQISVDGRFPLGVNRLEGARDFIVGIFIEQLLESLGIELAARHAKLARPFLRSLKEWGRNRDGCLHSPSITQLYQLRRPSNRVLPIDPLAQDSSQSISRGLSLFRGLSGLQSSSETTCSSTKASRGQVAMARSARCSTLPRRPSQSPRPKPRREAAERISPSCCRSYVGSVSAMPAGGQQARDVETGTTD